MGNEIENCTDKLFDEKPKPLVIFKTEVDRYGSDITAMSNFFDGYIQQAAIDIRESSGLETLKEVPVANIGIINDVVHQADIVMKGNTMLLPDFDNLPSDIKQKLKKGVYQVAESKQVDDNLRAVIVDEHGVRVKDITLKKVTNNPGAIESVRSIGNQMQMRQIYEKLAIIQELQAYQIEKDRDRDIVVPFLDARTLIVEAETKKDFQERLADLRCADKEIISALNAVYADIKTTSSSFAKRANLPLTTLGNATKTYMEYLTRDLQIATMYVGVRMQLLEYLGETETAKRAMMAYQQNVYDFLTNPITQKGLSAGELMHNYFPYNDNNRNCWYTFLKEMTPALKDGMANMQLSIDGKYESEAYIVSVEDRDNEE